MYFNETTYGVQQLRIYKLTNKTYSHNNIEDMSEKYFANFCKNTLFNYNFSKD